MSKFLLFIIILNFIVVIYNIYMWFTVQVQNTLLEEENDWLRYHIDIEHKENYILTKN